MDHLETQPWRSEGFEVFPSGWFPTIEKASGATPRGTANLQAIVRGIPQGAMTVSQDGSVRFVQELTARIKIGKPELFFGEVAAVASFVKPFSLSVAELSLKGFFSTRHCCLGHGEEQHLAKWQSGRRLLRVLLRTIFL